MKKNKVIKIIIGVIFAVVFINIIGSFYFYNLAIKRGPKYYLDGNKDLEVSADTMEEFLEGDWRDWVMEQNFEQMTITSFDDLKLTGYFLRAKEPSNKLVILSHGYLGNAKQMGLFAEYYYEKLGYHIFMPDARGHGQSEGEYYGFGWHDRLDLVDWTKRLSEKLGKDTEMVLHGLSMGAATVLMASGENLPKNVKAVIADSPYSNVYDLFKYQMKRMYKLPAFPLLDSTKLVTKWKANYNLKEASALKQVKQTNIPILYIHGDADTFVPTKMTEELYRNTNSPSELFIVEGANHGEAYVLAKEQYIKKLKMFLGKYM